MNGVQVISWSGEILRPVYDAIFFLPYPCSTSVARICRPYSQDRLKLCVGYAKTSLKRACESHLQQAWSEIPLEDTDHLFEEYSIFKGI